MNASSLGMESGWTTGTGSLFSCFLMFRLGLVGGGLIGGALLATSLDTVGAVEKRR